MRCVAIALVLALVIPSARALAASAPLCAGERVRVTASLPGMMGAERLEVLQGVWLGAREGSLVLANEARPETLVVPLAQVRHLEVSRLGQGHAGTGIALGLMAGVIIGAVIGAQAYESEEGIRIGSSGQWSAAWAVGLGAVGTITGALIGNAIRDEGWADVPLESFEGRLSLHGHERGFRLGLSLRF